MRKGELAQPVATRFRIWLISSLAAAGTLLTAAPLWPGPSARITWASLLFVAAVGVVASFVARATAAACRSADVTVGAKIGVLLVLIVVVPLFVDLRTINTYTLPRFTVTFIGAMGIATIWAVEAVLPGVRTLWRNGLHWPVLALLGWTAMATATSVSPRLSLLGALDTNDGLLAAAACAVIFFAMAQAVTMDQVRGVLAVLYFGAGGLTVLYGLIQLHDRLISGPPWDWLRKADGESAVSLADGRIFSTFGNANHLAGFLAVLVPVGLALFMLYRSRSVRALTVAIVAGLLVELLQTASRGALLGSFVGIVVAVALLWPDVRRRRRMSLTIMAGVAVVVLVVAVTLTAVPNFSGKLSSGFTSSATLSLRGDIWKAGVAMANARPLLGQGPDTWVDRVPKYRGPEIVERYGAGVFSNGAHNLFVNQLAATGYPGLFLLLSVLAYATMRAMGTWRRLRHIEAAGAHDQARSARAARHALVAVVGGLVAYVVQGSFNLSQIGLSFVYWVLLGLLCVLSLGAGVPVSLRPRAVLGRAQARALVADDFQPPVRRAKQGEAYSYADPASGAVALLACLVLVLASSTATRPYRADHNAWAARHDSALAIGAAPAEAQSLARRAATRRANSVALNPWEPSYLTRLADDHFRQALSLPERSPSQLTALRSARGLFERAIALRPHTVVYLERYAEVLLKIHDAEPGVGEARAGAIRALQRAVSADPATTTRARERLHSLTAG